MKNTLLHHKVDSSKTIFHAELCVHPHPELMLGMFRQMLLLLSSGRQSILLVRKYEELIFSQLKPEIMCYCQPALI